MNKNTAYLDGFRGICAFWVLAAHCAIWGAPEIRLPLPKIAVDIFMIMSGFLMAYMAIRMESLEPLARPRNWIRFYVRRFWRLAPAYYLTLFVAVALADAFVGGYVELHIWNGGGYAPSVTFDAKNIFAHLSFIFGLIPRYSSSTALPDWSLGLEMQFYLVFPLVYLAIKRFGHAKVCVPLLILTGAMIVGSKKWATLHGGEALFPEPSFLFLRFHLFLIGIMLCDAFYRADIGRNRRWQLCASAVALSLVQVVFYRAEALLLTGCVSLIILIETQGPGHVPISRMLGNRFTRFLADMSYSVYLMHGFFLSIGGALLYRQPEFRSLDVTMRYAIILTMVTVGTYSVAWVVEKLVEQPGIRFGKRLTMRTARPEPVSG